MWSEWRLSPGLNSMFYILLSIVAANKERLVLEMISFDNYYQALKVALTPRNLPSLNSIIILNSTSVILSSLPMPTAQSNLFKSACVILPDKCHLEQAKVVGND